MMAVTRATFVERKACLSCGGSSLRELASGKLDEGVVGRFIGADPWGESPLPHIQGQNWLLVACNECGLAFHQRILSPEWNEIRFSKWMSLEAMQEFEAREPTRPAFEKAAANVAHVLSLELLTRPYRGSSVPRVLDFGCGHGEFLGMCALFGFQTFGVDRSEGRRAHASIRILPSIEDVAGLGPFHAVTLFEVLEHLDEPLPVLQRLRTLLASHAILILETPDCTGVVDIKTMDDFRRIHPLDHINAFTPGTLADMARRAGFERVSRPMTCVASEPTRVAKAVGRSVLGPLLKPTTQMYFRATN